jgi:hypothetical protein
MPKASDPEVPRCLSALCGFTGRSYRHRVGDRTCTMPLATPTPAQAEALTNPAVRDRDPKLELQQNHGRLRLVCVECGAMNEDFLRMVLGSDSLSSQHGPNCPVVS